MLNSLWENIFRKHEKNTPDVLKENILFQDLSQKELRFVTHIVHIRNYHKNEAVFRQGEVGYGMYIIANGKVDITVEDSDRKAGNEEHQTHVARLVMGDFFGELALVEKNGKRSAHATAVEDTELIGFFKPNLFEILERKPATGVKITLRLSEVLGQRLIETTEKLTMLNEEISQLKAGTER